MRAIHTHTHNGSCTLQKTIICNTGIGHICARLSRVSMLVHRTAQHTGGSPHLQQLSATVPPNAARKMYTHIQTYIYGTVIYPHKAPTVTHISHTRTHTNTRRIPPTIRPSHDASAVLTAQWFTEPPTVFTGTRVCKTNGPPSNTTVSERINSVCINAHRECVSVFVLAQLSTQADDATPHVIVNQSAGVQCRKTGTHRACKTVNFNPPSCLYPAGRRRAQSWPHSLPRCSGACRNRVATTSDICTEHGKQHLVGVMVAASVC